MTILSQKVIQPISARYYQAFKLRPVFMDVYGDILFEGRKRKLLAGLPVFVQTNAFSLQEAIRWGEPFVFYPSRGIVNWVVALVDQRRVQGGLLGGEVLTGDISREEVIAHLVERGIEPGFAKNIAVNLPVWPVARIKQSAVFLQEDFYRVSGWKPILLEENRIKSLQQRHISEAM
ncbi:MAG: PocR ligand-binding domain-containing protein, partial [Kiritimatiellia bacterium]|nr:PocR ligand-binding domain-containing protein [Kiritimatiellia bacterium]